MTVANAPESEGPEPEPRAYEPGFYARLLRLRSLRPKAWQLFLLNEGSLIIAVILVLADLATAWSLLALPIIVAIAAKFTDVVAGAVRRAGSPPRQGTRTGQS